MQNKLLKNSCVYKIIIIIIYMIWKKMEKICIYPCEVLNFKINIPKKIQNGSSLYLF